MWGIILVILGIILVFGYASDTKPKQQRRNSWEANDDLYRTEDEFNHHDEEHDIDENSYCPDCDEHEDDIDENT